jgi:hypothetical protein
MITICRNTLFIFIVCLQLGCASISNGTRQNVTVSTLNDKKPENTICTLKNEEGSWTATPNNAIKINRDGNTMDIQCVNDAQKGVNHLDPDFEGYFMGINFIWDFCTISCLFDAANNAFYEYPSLVTVPMKEK